MAKFNPATQIEGLKEIENDLIKNLSFDWKYNSTLVFNFSLSNTKFDTGNNQIEKIVNGKL